MDYRVDNSDGNFEDAEFMLACPYCENFYRQFPPTPPFGGGQGFGPQIGPPATGMPPFGGGQGFGPQIGLPGTGIPPFGGGQSFGPPIGPPPTGTPTKQQAQFGPQAAGQPGIQAVSPGSIRPCVYRYVYIWLRNGRSFWAWLVYVDRNTAAGWRWVGRRWVYFGIDLRRIDYFACY